MKEERFETMDFHLACALLASGFSVVDIRLEGSFYPQRGVFVFRRNAKIGKAIDEYHTDKLEVSPRILFDSVRKLKGWLANKQGIQGQA